MKEEFNKDMEHLRNKESKRNPVIKCSLNQIKNIGENLSSRLEQVEDRILGLKDKTDSKEEIEELLDKILKTYERNMQELSNSNKKPNMQTMGIKEGKELQAKGTQNSTK
jgi:sugar-specific transcriptional regulator TrmB